MNNNDMTGGYGPYFDYLMSIVGGEEWWGQFEPTMLRLFERKYYWKHPLDENWKGHVETLRLQAFRQVMPIYILQGEPSILEVLVSLTIHVGNSIMWTEDTDYVSRLPEYFNDIITALHFDCDAQNIDSAIDSFLDGETLLAGYELDRLPTLWEQANLLFADQFEIENG